MEEEEPSASTTSTSSSYLLEINLISAQNLKPPSTNLRRRLQTYAVTWVDPSHKLRTRIDNVGGENPTWNDKFFFRVSPHFLSGDTSAVSVEIFSVGMLKDPLIGSVRFLINNSFSKTGIPSFSAVQIRRPSGRFHGVLNVGAMVVNCADFATLGRGVSAIGYRDLMGEDRRRQRKLKKKRNGVSGGVGGEKENSGENSWETGSDAGSSCSSTSATSTVLKDWNWNNGRKEMAGKKERLDGAGGGILRRLGFQRKIHLSSSDENMQIS